MVSDEPTDGRCNAPAGEDNAYFCEQYPITDDDGEPVNGRCYYHGGKNPGAPQGNQNAAGEHDLDQDGNVNALQHGLFLGRGPGDLYPALDPGDREFVRDLVEKYVAFGGWDSDDPRVERLLSTCVDIWRETRAKGIVIEDGPSQDTTIGVDPRTGEPIWAEEEHHLHGPIATINQTIRMNLKDMDLYSGEDGSVSIESGGDLTVNFNIEEVPDDTEYIDVESEAVED